MAKSALLNSSIAKKYWMALTGLFLCVFLIGHLFGNLQLLNTNIHVAKDHFNEYAKFMATSPVIKILSYLTYISIIFHVVDGIVLTLKNKSARKEPYICYKGAVSSSWASRNMGLLGSIILVFIIVHMNMFWAKAKFGGLNNTLYATANNEVVEDLYTLTVKSFQEGFVGLVWTLLYLVSMVALAFHLLHGVSSSFKSLGINHIKYNKTLITVSKIFAVIIPLLFAVIPLFIRFIL